MIERIGSNVVACFSRVHVPAQKCGTRLISAAFLQPKREGQGTGKCDVAISSQHGILNNHICETSPHQDHGDREDLSSSGSAETELFVDKSMTTTSLKVQYTSWFGLGPAWIGVLDTTLET